MSIAATEVRFTIEVGRVPRSHLAEAERKAEEAFVLALLRCGDISVGRASELLGVDRWELGKLMSAYGISPFDDTRTREGLEREVEVHQ